jgi:hypothetical protein
MNLVQFIENRYQELTEQMQKKDAFDVLKDSEIKAAHHILTNYRKLMGIGLIPKVLYHFFEVKMKWRAEPVPVLLNKIKEDKLAKEEEAKKLKELKENNVSSITPHISTDHPAS